jgi:DNA-directed RNA polymerase specialized sigma24 family protein
MMAQHDAVLLAARHGDSEAQRLFVARHAKAVYNLALTALGSAPEVEQVLQRTMLEALQASELPACRTGLWLGQLTVRQLRALGPGVQRDCGDASGLTVDQRLALLLVDGLRFSLAEAAWVLDEPDISFQLRRARLAAFGRRESRPSLVPHAEMEIDTGSP